MADVILGIETSCDETSAAVLVGEGGRPELASLVILSQDVHQVFGGVVPELASRAHLRALDPVIGRALDEAGVPLSAVDAVAVTQGPGLVGALLVGVCYAKGLAAGLARPLIGVHHLEGHLFAPALEDPDLDPPFVALVVSGGTPCCWTCGSGAATGSWGRPGTTPPARRSTRWPRCWSWDIRAAR